MLILKKKKKKQKELFILHHSSFVHGFDIKNDKIISCCNNNVIKLWNIEFGTLERKWEKFNESVLNVKFLNSNKFLIIYNNSIKIVDVHSGYEKPIKLSAKIKKINCISIGADGSLIAIAIMDRIKIISNCTQYLDLIYALNFLDVLSVSSNKYVSNEKETFMTDIRKDFIEKESKNLLMTLFPADFTLIHFLCYLDDAKTLNALLNIAIENEIYIPPIIDKLGNNPFTILINNQNSSNLEILIKYYSHENIASKSFQSCSEIFTEVISDLLYLKIPGVEKFLDSRIFTCVGNSPKYGLKINKYKICTFNSTMPSYEDFKIMVFGNQEFEFNESNEYKKNKVFYKVIDFPNILNPKYKFMQFLIDFPSDHIVFSSQMVSYLLQFKWKENGKKIFAIKALIYIAFLLLSTYDAVFLYSERITETSMSLVRFYLIEVCLMIINTIFFFLEFSKIKKGGIARYFRNFWSYLNFIIIFSSYVTNGFAIISNDHNDSDTQRVLHAFNILFIYIGLLSYTRIFSTMSFMCRIILIVIYDIRFFLMILIMLAVSFTFSSKLIFFFGYLLFKIIVNF